jgi:pimeloyl-ACP methyl ester carboxylesterase
MKKLSLLLACMAIYAGVAAQDRIESVRKQFDSLIEKTRYGIDSTAGKFYNIRGFNMYCEVYGQGQPLLIIHGNGGSINNFIKQLPYFSQKYKVIIADSRAQGRSIDKGDSLTYEMMADDYAELLTQLSVNSAYVIGWSDGGINALLLALRHPEKVKKMAITGANLRPDSSAVFQEVWDMVRPAYNMLKKAKKQNEQMKAQFKLLRLLCDQPHIATTDLHGIKAPTLVIGGDHDVIKEEHTLEIYKNIPKAYLWILPNSGHSTPIVYADMFNQVVDDFFMQPYRNISKGDRFF